MADPLFENIATRDFRLKSNSPAKNKGANLGYTIDYAGNPVPSGSAPDMGAFEFQEAATVIVTGVSVTPTSASLIINGTTQLTATVAPANATNKNVIWSSSNATVATVSATGLVTAKAAGTATITVTTQNGSKTATSAITVTTGIPAAPSIFAASNIQATQATLSWVDNANNETGFVLERRTVNPDGAYVLVQNLGVDVVTYTDAALSPSSTYQYRLSATNASGPSAYTYLATPITTLSAPVATPSGFVASNIQATQVTLTWLDNANNETGFVIERRTNNPVGNYDLVANVGADVQTYVDNTVSPASGYQYRLSAKNATTVSDYTYLATPITTPDVAGTGLQATYYNNIDFTGTQVARIDPTVNFNWGTGAPVTGIDGDTFSARWNGQVKANYTETYTFYTNSDDGVRLSVNNVQLVNNWTNHSPTENNGTIALVAGQKYNIVMEYFENTSGAVAQLSWSSASQGKQIIPVVNLYPGGSAPRIASPLVETVSKEVSVYPNPAKDELNVTFNAEKENIASIDLITPMSQGVIKKLHNAVKGTNTVTLDVRGLDAGMYLLRVKNGSIKTVNKFYFVKLNSFSFKQIAYLSIFRWDKP